MKKLAAVLIFSLPLAAQPPARHPAGTDAQGNTLTVIERHFPESPASYKRCVPKDQYVLEVSRGGRTASLEPVVTLCQADIPIETNVGVGKNLIQVDREGGAQAGYFLHRTFQLSPWRATKMDACQFLGSEKFTYEEWDFLTMKGQAWTGSGADSGEICGHGPQTFSYLLAPIVPLDAATLQAARPRLGSCALTLDASGKNGFVTWGKPDTQDPLQVKLLWTGERTLLAQVLDPKRATRPSASWINADHFEIWMDALHGESMWQFGIPVDEGPVQIGHGKPPHLPIVHRWTSNLEDGHTVTTMLIEFPVREEAYSSVTIVYSQSRDGLAQKRLIATSPFKRGAIETLAQRGSGLDRNSAAEYVTCGLVNGVLDVTGSPQKPLEVPPPWQ